MAATAALTACASGASPAQPAVQASGHALTIMTPPAKGGLAQVTWALYRDPTTLDPISAFDYPENTVITTMCDSLQRQEPDGSVQPGLATITYRNALNMVLTIRPGVTFWDGQPLTSADVVYSLDRNLNPKLAGFYATVFDRVHAITALSSSQVLITLTQPDYWLPGELSSMAGIVIEKRFASLHPTTYGNPGVGAMCTGPYKLASWVPGSQLTVVRNPHYWDKRLQPTTQTIVFKGISDAAALTSGLLTGAIDGTYLTDTSTLRVFERASNLHVYHGPSLDTDFFIITNLSGPLGDIRVRQALSMAFDRKSYIQAVYAGAAQIPRLATNPGSWGYEKSVFQQAWNATPEPTVNVVAARKLIAEAGAAGKTITIGTSTDLSAVSEEADAWQAAAQSIGLKVKLYNVSATNYINFFTDPNARKPVDAIMTTTYGDYADPTSLTATYLEPNGSQDYDGYSNPVITAALNAARAEADPAKRAADTVVVERLIMKYLPWIPAADPDTDLVMNTRITGVPASFSYMGEPWAATLGRS
ncbi:MAG: ABC transporter substrate-binding protein [Streptosporangiaceae bacterium]